jgi:hypothetical protein
MLQPIAKTDLSEVLRPQSVGRTVNSHVIESVSEPKPDFAAMNRAIQGRRTSRPEQRGGPAKDGRAAAERA